MTATLPVPAADLLRVEMKRDVCGHVFLGADECRCWLWGSDRSDFHPTERAPFRWAGAR